MKQLDKLEFVEGLIMIKKFVYLPEMKSECNKPSKSDMVCQLKERYPCPCCGYLTLPAPKEHAIAYICPVCYWENDAFIVSDNEPSDENHGMTLKAGRDNYKAFGACSKDMLIHVRKPKPEEFPK